MCENKEPIPLEVALYAVKLANGEFAQCDAFFQSPRGELRGKIVFKDGTAKFVCTGNEWERSFAEQCTVGIRLWTSTVLHFPDGGYSEVMRKARYPGDVEGMVPANEKPKPGAEASRRL